jgi:serine/threonine-protein kinase RsbW
MIERRYFPRTVGSVPLARHFVATAFARAPQEVADRAAVIASELATNAVRHARTDFVVQVETTPIRVRVEVTDTGTGSPVVRALDAQAPSGRGLRIVDTLADEWGVIETAPGPGKTVWFWLWFTGSSDGRA